MRAAEEEADKLEDAFELMEARLAAAREHVESGALGGAGFKHGESGALGAAGLTEAARSPRAWWVSAAPRAPEGAAEPHVAAVSYTHLTLPTIRLV